MNLKEAMFGGGCFWGAQGQFDNIKGVIETEVGYAGGHSPAGGPNPTYEQVCTGKTGHAEVVHLRYDSNVVSYKQLLDAFWNMHDPTTPDRQGPDIGSNYRSIIFYYDEEQKAEAEESKGELNKSKKYSSPVVTEIVGASQFWKAEEYHQKYFKKTGRSICH